MAREWPEYAFWYEGKDLKYEIFHHVRDYSDKFINPNVEGPWYFYRPSYQWDSPWMIRQALCHSVVDVSPEKIPPEIRALHLLIS